MLSDDFLDIFSPLLLTNVGKSFASKTRKYNFDDVFKPLVSSTSNSI